LYLIKLFYLIEYLINNKYLIELDEKFYAFAVSMRSWGLIIAEAFDPDDKDPLAYVKWAFCTPEGETITVDENKDPSL